MVRTGAGRAEAGQAGAGTAASLRGELWTAGAAVSAVLYAVLRAGWEQAGMWRPLSPVGDDLIVFTGWSAVWLCLAAAAVLAATLAVRPRGPARWVPVVAAYAVGAALVVSGALLLLDVVGVIFPGLGIPVFPLGVFSRAVCVTLGVLVLRAGRRHARRTGRGCAACGRAIRQPAGEPAERAAPPMIPVWAFAGAYAAVLGCLTRIGAQLSLDLGGTGTPTPADRMAGTASQVMFEAGFLLAGTVLPLALVHRWGRVWPRWTPALGGRRVPRPLVLWPAAAVSCGLVAYFGVGLGQMVAERLAGRRPFAGDGGGPELPEAFFWVAVPAYFVWGVGMAVAAVGYARATRASCGDCGG